MKSEVFPAEVSGVTEATVPLLDLGPQIEALWSELTGAMEQVARSGHFIMGPNVQAFEAEMAAYLGVRHAVGVNSGTDALVIALRATGVGPGDEVITTPFSFFATAEAISHLGARPVFVDIDPVTYNLAPELVEAALTARTRALLPVHLFGQAAEMDPIMGLAGARGLRVVEDTAQALGASYRGRPAGTIGAAGAFSFFPTKPLGAFGDGGLLATDDDDVAAAARMLRVHGAKKKYHNEAIGYNSRLDELQAAILRVKLPHLDAWNDGRRAAAARYTALLAGVEGVVPPREAASGRHVYHQYTIRVTGGRRDLVQQKLKESGIGTMIYYPVPIHCLPAYAGQYGSLPVAEAAAGEVLSLPIWPEIQEETQARVVEALAAPLR
jgi:dTDP-4-amino-4,6-dideoxygalactose transaminase